MNKALSFSTMALIGAMASTAHGQIFSDDFGDATKWVIGGDGNSGTVEVVDFNIDYSSYDIFGDGFITASIPEAPNSDIADTATTGIFMSANNDRVDPLVPGSQDTSLIAMIYAVGVDVGAGTATEDYVVTFDAFHMTTAGSGGSGPPSATNYVIGGINYTPGDLPASDGDEGPYRGPFTTAGTSGQTLAVTVEQGGSDDYEYTVGNLTIEDRNEGFTGLATAHIEQQFIAAGFASDGSDYSTPIGGFNQDDGHATPQVGNEAAFDNTDGTTIAATANQYWREQFPQQTGPVPFDANGTNFVENDNDVLPGGTPYNQWVEWEIYYVDGIHTIVMNDVPVLQVDPSLAGDQSQITSDSGTFGIGFVDGFSSFNLDPQGSQGVFYDNIELEAVLDPSTVPDLVQYLVDNNYAPAVGGLLGDLDNDGDLDVDDLDLFVIGGTTEAEGDIDMDGDVDINDINAWLALFGTVNGDANLDFTVLTSDLAILAANFGTAVSSYGLGDFNKDGVVDTGDLAILAANFGTDNTPALSAVAVPEPATLALIGLGGLAALTRRRQA
ncbi:MAG: PEP-CTERM sorting domain-containing protein [Planctomycetota bacterium]